MKQKHIINCPCYNIASKQEVEDFLLNKIKKSTGEMQGRYMDNFIDVVLNKIVK